MRTSPSAGLLTVLIKGKKKTMWTSLIPVVGSLLDKVIPDPKLAAEAKLKALEMAQKGELANLDADVRLALGQMEINKVEAGTDMFRGGWRPAVAWVCVFGFALQMVVAPVLTWVTMLTGNPIPFPDLDTGTLVTMLMGMLGLGTLRTQEKIKGLK